MSDEPTPIAGPHPLEPLTLDELATARDVLIETGALHDEAVVTTLMLAEPSKTSVIAWPGHSVARRAEAVIIDRRLQAASVVIVDLDAKAVESTTDLDGRQPSFTVEEFMAGIMLTKADPRWQEAMRRRGISDFDQVQVDMWSTGTFVPDGMVGRRLARCVSFLRPNPLDNGYARPLQGVIAIVDVGTNEVVSVEDHGLVTIPDGDGNYDVPPGGRPFRTDLKPISITQPEGTSFQVDGHHVRWQGWDFRVSVHPLDGLTLHQVGYEDDGNMRSILYRASLAEMVVPYADPDESFYWRNAFDGGEYGLGKFVNSLELGCDCVGEIVYLDSATVDARGNPATRANAVCMHEEDFGVLWKHHDLYTGAMQTRRSRRLVVSSFYTVGNYEYGVFWYFYLDGTIQLEMKLTGIVQTKAIEPGATSVYGNHVAPGLVAPHHQHLFCFRLDFDIDGLDNTVYEVDVVPDHDDGPWGNSFVVDRTAVDQPDPGRRVDTARARTWHIVNDRQLNALGLPVGYKLVPDASSTLLARPGSPIAQRAVFATNHLWVTRHEEGRMRPAGTYPNQSPGGDGIDRWVSEDESLVDTDTVVWHTFGPTHVARPEDWPVMPVEYAGFTLKPVGFFDRNPTLDVAPTGKHCAGGDH